MIDRVAFSLFGLNVYWYGVIIAAGLALAAVLMLHREQKLGLKKDTSIDLLLVTLPVALIAARAYYVIFSWDSYRDDLLSVLDIRGGGLAIYGGVIGGFLAVFTFSKVKKVSFAALADLAAPSLALGQAIGRWGNFTNGEAYGREAARAWMRFFPMAVHIEADGLWHYATFFYESVWCFLIVAALLAAEKKGLFRRRGDMFLWYMLLYGAERAFVEGLRTDSLMWGSLRVSQLLSALLAAAVTAVWLVRCGKRKWIAAAGCVCAVAAVWLPDPWTAILPGAAIACGAVSYGYTEKCL